jgi:hypothetical protein
MYFASPVTGQNNLVFTQLGDLLNIYTKSVNTPGDESDFATILRFSNWVVFQMKKDHALGLTFPTKEMLVLVFIMETIYGMKSCWVRNSEGELKGSWK